MNQPNPLSAAVADEMPTTTREVITPMRRFKLGAGFFRVEGALMVLGTIRVLAPEADAMPSVRPLNDDEREGLSGLAQHTHGNAEASAAITGVTHVVEFPRGFMLSNSWRMPAISNKGIAVYVKGDALDFDLVMDWPTELMQIAFDDESIEGVEADFSHEQNKEAMVFAMQLLGASAPAQPSSTHEEMAHRWGTKAGRVKRRGEELFGPTAVIHCYHLTGDIAALSSDEDGGNALLMFDELYVGVEPGSEVKRERVAPDLREQIAHDAKGFDAAETIGFHGSVVWDEVNGKACMRFGDLVVFMSPGTKIEQVQMMAPKSVLDDMGYKNYYEVLPEAPGEERTLEARSTTTGDSDVIAA